MAPARCCHVRMCALVILLKVNCALNEKQEKKVLKVMAHTDKGRICLPPCHSPACVAFRLLAGMKGERKL